MPKQIDNKKSMMQKHLKEQLKDIEVEVSAKTGEGKLFGSISTKQIAEALKTT